MRVEDVENGYVKIAVSQEDLEESIDGLQQLKPLVQKIVVTGNGTNKVQAAKDVEELGKHFDTAITAMIMLLTGFEDYK